ncbi:MAG: hypothetical protein H6615_07050 [Ignavibacteria bacterium]|nr:hypothetical protein [Ignavibacteria bacterium]
MNREVIRKYLHKIDESYELDLSNIEEVEFYKIYNDILFKTIIRPRNGVNGLYKLTSQGKSVLYYA